MIRCPFCNEPLDERWLRKAGASLLGKTTGPTKARAKARQASLVRWQRVRKAKAATSKY
jgi:hypothetical protein